MKRANVFMELCGCSVYSKSSKSRQSADQEEEVVWEYKRVGDLSELTADNIDLDTENKIKLTADNIDLDTENKIKSTFDKISILVEELEDITQDLLNEEKDKDES